MESEFPGYTLKKLDVDDGGKGVEVEKTLNVRNTLIKLALDQTIGAVVNVAAYIGGSRALRGLPLEECWSAVKEVMLLLFRVQRRAYANIYITSKRGL